MIKLSFSHYLPTKRKKIGFVLLFVFILVFFLWHKKNNDPKEETLSALTVTSVTAEQTEWAKTIEASGPIMPWQEAIIGAEISGQRLVQILVNVGDQVKKGQVLARYNIDMLEAQKKELEANWIQAASDRKRAESLKKSGAMSMQQIEAYANKAEVAKSRLDAKNVELHYATVTAPDDGVISARTATLGAVGSPGSELFRMILNNRYEWRGELTAEQLETISPQQSVKLTLPDGSFAQAKIRQISPSFNSQTRMISVYADIEPNNHVHAGMYANGVIEMGLSKLIKVPAESVIIHDGYSYVYKLIESKQQLKAIQKRVTVGRHLGNQIEVIAGLNAGERIVAKGAGFLHDGDIVRLAPNMDQKS